MFQELKSTIRAVTPTPIWEVARKVRLALWYLGRDVTLLKRRVLGHIRRGIMAVARVPARVRVARSLETTRLGDFSFSHQTEPYATHQPVLYEIAVRSEGPILELGCGEGSTLLLHRICEAQGRRLLTIDNDASWLSKYRFLESDFHRLISTNDWLETLQSDAISKTRWGLVFVDSAPWESRDLAVRILGDRATYLIVHDCDYFPLHGIFGRESRPNIGSSDRGERNYAEVFRSWREYFPNDPWPAPTGPPTLLGSNASNCDIVIDFAVYSPNWINRVVERLAKRGLARV